MGPRKLFPCSALQRDPGDASGIARAVAEFIGARHAGLLWADAGDGRARDATGEAAFRVLLWPGGAAARRALGLPPQDFHISLGFRSHDVHGRSKGLASLVGGAPPRETVQPLIAVAARLSQGPTPPDGDDAQGAEQLAAAALLGASAHGLVDAEAGVHAVLCQLHGRLRRPALAMEHADLLLAFPGHSDDEVGVRCRALALVQLGRCAEALPELSRARELLHQLPGADERQAVEARLCLAEDICRKRLRSTAGPAPPVGDAGSGHG